VCGGHKKYEYMQFFDTKKEHVIEGSVEDEDVPGNLETVEVYLASYDRNMIPGLFFFTSTACMWMCASFPLHILKMSGLFGIK
jgi:hypothetical protein